MWLLFTDSNDYHCPPLKTSRIIMKLNTNMSYWFLLFIFGLSKKHLFQFLQFENSAKAADGFIITFS